ncbi:MAG TPA: GNAT family N-acetyltransferase [Nocardioidaceae bacterium]|nr:GNAT family N-acetyltransferase [Nocardioidaceae bacterium]
MNVDAVPAGYAVRSPEPTDAEVILDLVSAYNSAIVGYADFTLDDVRDDLAEPGFDLTRDAWLAFDSDRRLVGYGWACADGDSDQVDVDVMATDATMTEWLLDRSTERAREMGRERGHAKVTLHKGIYRDDVGIRSPLETRGFAPVTSFHRMRIDFDGPVELPQMPAGLTLRDAVDDATRRDAHAVQTAAFSEHFGYVAKSYSEWFELMQAKSTFAWSQMWVGDLDGRPVAMCGRTDQFIEDDDCGYVQTLGVLDEARGRGIATYLLRRAFAVDAAAGRTGTILHVDANNTTPALSLYESVGMRPVLVVDIWDRILAVD